MKSSILWPIIFCLALVAGCVTPPSSADRIGASMAVPDYSPPVLDTAATPTDNGPGLSIDRLMSLSPVETYQRIDQQKLFSVSFKNADLQDALALLSRESGVPVIAGKDVGGTVTASMRDKSLGEILYALLEPLGLTAYVDRGVILVTRPRLVSKTFYVNYIKDKRTSTSTTNASVSASSGSSGSVAGGSVSSSGSGGQGNVSVSTSGTTDFWEEIKAGLEAIVFGGSGNDSGSGKQLVINEMAGVIYVIDFAGNMRNVEKFLDDVERSVKRQVLIQAHIVEVTLDESYAMGVDWDYLLNKNSELRLTQNLTPVPNSEVFQLSLDTGDFNMLLDAMQELGSVNMLSSPKISTLNNQKAVIKLTTKEVTWINETSKNSTGEIISTSTTPQIDEVGLFLDVTPSINASGRITLQIHPSISEIQEVSVSPDKTSSKPVINVREVDTIADVMAGQTVVIAGLIADRFRTTRTSVPGLGELPVLGNLFSHLQQEKSKVELVIFLTPYVLDDRSIDRIRSEHEGRLEQITEINRLLIPSLDNTLRKPKLIPAE